MTIFTQFLKTLSFFFVLLVFSTITHAQSIKGKVFDSQNGDPLIGATVRIEKGDLQLFTPVKLDGSFQFKNIPAGTYKVQVSFLGYKTSQQYNAEAKAGEVNVVNIKMQDNTTSLTEVRVNGHLDKESDAKASNLEKNANNVMNVVSATSIAISPDVTVANVMQRVSGVSMERSNSGEAQYAIIRGMDKRYNTTLINGVKIPSPDNKNRFVPLDIFPADLIERIEVSKTLTPDMEGDASGGVINLVMKTAPDHFKLEGNLGGGYGQLFLNRGFSSFNSSSVNLKSPGEFLASNAYASIGSFPYQNLVTSSKSPSPNLISNLTFGDRFLKQKLGVLFSGSFQNSFTGSNSFALVENATVGPAHGRDSSMNQTFPESYKRKYSSQVTRLGLVSNIDYKFNDDNSLNLFGTYVQLNDRRVRETDDLTLGNYSLNGYVGGFQTNRLIETRSTLQSIYSVILQGKNKITHSFFADYSLVSSLAKRALPDRAQFDVSQRISPNQSGQGLATSVTYDTTAVNKESRNWDRNTDRDLSAYLNLHYNTKIGTRDFEIKLGGMARHKNRDNFANSYNLSPIPDAGSTYQKFISIPVTRLFFLPSSDAMGTSASNAGTYTFNEDILAFYGQAKYYFSDRLDVVFGLRVENTSQNYNTSLPVTIAGKSGQINYIDYLPSLNAKYTLSDKQALRFSYFESIYRPAYSDLIPYQDNSGFYSDNYPTLGDPTLKHSVIQNLDFRYELFPEGLDQFMVGAFYKLIKNPIEYGFVQTSFSADLTLSPANYGNANNYGLEVVFRKYFGDFGVSGNYTYTHSLIHSTKRFEYIDQSDNSDHTILVSQPRPLQGQSAHVGNFSFLYKDTRTGLDAQLALVYTGERINSLSIYKDLDTWEKGTLNLDFSAQKEIGKHFIFYVKANNLLNTPYELIIKQQNRAYSGNFKLPQQESPKYKTIEYDQFYARYLLGVRFKFY